MKLQRNGSKALAIGAMALVGSLSLAACGTDDNSTSSTGSSAAASGAAPAAQIACGKGGQLLGAGSTAQTNAVDVWKAAFGSACSGSTITYGGGGSGAGVQQFNQGKVAFAGSDSALKPAEVDASKQVCTGGQGVNLPMVGGLISIVFNVENVDKLVLDGPTVAKIFDSQITKWNDPAIAALNSGVKLPDTDIAVVRRADGSGTSFIWTHYLAQVNPEWKSKVGEGTTVNWPTGTGGKGNDGVAAFVQRLPGAIGYVEWAYAKQNKMTYTSLKNAAGNVVEPKTETFKAAAAGADWSKSFYQILTNEPGKDAWPVVGATFVLVHSSQDKPDRGKETLKFFDWAFKNGSQTAQELDYITLPDGVVSEIRTQWKAKVKDAAGKPIAD